MSARLAFYLEALGRSRVHVHSGYWQNLVPGSRGGSLFLAGLPGPLSLLEATHIPSQVACPPFKSAMESFSCFESLTFSMLL